MDEATIEKRKKRVVVAGASAGAGRAIALRFGRAGWRVALLARDAERLDTARAEIERAGGEALVVPTDVVDVAAVRAARDHVVAAWGGIDVWVNSAMVTVVAPIAETDPTEYRRVMDVIYMGCIHGTLAALDAMRERDEGTIVQVGSALAYRAIPLQSAYCAAKFAVRGFIDALRTELRHANSRIRVSMIQLPGMNTPQFDWARNKFAVKYRPLGNVYNPEVAAEAVYRAATRGNAELWVGLSAMQAIVGQLLFPRILDRMLARKAWEGQLSDVPEPPGRPDNVLHTVRGPFGIDGRFADRAKPRAWTIDPGHARVALASSAALAIAAWTAARLRRRIARTP